MQRSDPLAHSLLSNQIINEKNSLSRFIKPDVLHVQQTESYSSILDNKSNYLPLSEVYVGLVVVTKSVMNKLLNEG